MRRKRRARSVFTILSLVMAVTVMLGSFMAFADESSDWRDQNRDQGPASHEVNLLEDRRDEKVYSWQKNLLGDDDADVSVQRSEGESGELSNGVPPVGLSGVWQIGYSEPPLGYSMTVTYDYFGEEAPEGVESIGPNGGQSPSLGFSVIVKDGDLVPDEAALNVAVDADPAAGASMKFKVRFNDTELTDEETENSLEFRAVHKVTEDGAIVIEPEFVFAPMAFNGPGTIIIDTNSVNRAPGLTNDGWQDDSPWGSPDSKYTYRWSCSVCGLSSQIYYTHNNIWASRPTITSVPDSVHRQYNCDVTMYNKGSTTNHTVIMRVDPTDTTLTTPTLNSVVGSAWWGTLVSSTAHETHDIAIDNQSTPGAVTFPAAGIGTHGTAKVTFTGPVTINTTTIDRPTNFGNGAYTTAGSPPVHTQTPVNAAGAGTVTFKKPMTGRLNLNQQNVIIDQTTAKIGDGTSFVAGTTTNGGPGTITNAKDITLSNGGTVETHSQVKGTGAGYIVNGTVDGLVECDGVVTITTVALKSNGKIKSNSTANPAIDVNGGTEFSGTLEAWKGTVDITGIPSILINRINAKNVVIPTANTNTITTLSLLKNGTTSLNIKFAGRIGTFFAGGANAASTDTKVTVETPTKIFTAAYAGAEYDAVIGCTLVLDSVKGESNANGTSTGTYIPKVYAGGLENVTGPGASDCSTIEIDSGTMIANLYGGTSLSGKSTRKPVLNLNTGSTVTNAHGGGGGGTGTGQVTIPVINVQGGKVNYVYGGNRGGAGALNNVQINVGTTTAAGTVENDVYGGHYSGSAAMAAVSNTYAVQINVGVANAGTVKGSVYGGHATGMADTTTIANITEVNIGGSTYAAKVGTATTDHVFGGGKSGTVNSSEVTIGTGSVLSGSVYGGGAGGITRYTKVDIEEDMVQGTNIGGNIYGGGSDGKVFDTTVNITETVDGSHIYGGSSGSGEFTNYNATSTSAKVNINNNVDNANVYGGSAEADISATGGTVVIIDSAATITEGSVYGANEEGGEVYKTSIQNDGTVTGAAAPEGRIFGGHEDADTDGTITDGVKIVNNGTVDNGIYGGAVTGTFAIGDGTNGSGVTITNNNTVTSGGIHGGSEVAESDYTGNIAITNADPAGVVSGGIYGGNYDEDLSVTGDIIIKNLNTTVTTPVTGDIVGGNDHKGAFSATGDVGITNNGGITGGIYGGNNSTGTGAVPDTFGAGTVTIANTAKVPDGIYGGSNDGTEVAVTGQVKITNSGAVGNTSNKTGIHGGSKKITTKNVVSDVYINNSGAITNGGIYGGDEDGVLFQATGGGVQIINNAAVPHGVYGGSEKGSIVNIAGQVNIDNNTGGAIATNGIHGGGKTISTSTTVGSVYIDNAEDITIGGIYGGDEDGKAFTSNGIVTIINSKNVPHGIYGGTQSGTTVSITGVVTITNSGAVGATSGTGIHGGSDNATTGHTAPRVIINNTNAVTGGIYGGNQQGGTFTITTNGISITNSSTVSAGIFGGSENSGDTAITGGVAIGNTGAGTVGAPGIYGGNRTTAGTSNTINGGVKITNDSTAATGVTGGIYGGTMVGKFDISATGTTYGVLIDNSGTVSNVGIYGGSKYVPDPTKPYGAAVTTTITNGTHIINSGTVNSDIYGGGYNGNSIIGDHDGGTGTFVELNGGTVVINGGPGTGSVYGGNGPRADGAISSTEVDVFAGSIVENDVYGGGHNGISPLTGSNEVTGQAEVTVRGGSTIQNGTVYGGGKDGSPTGSTKVHVGAANIVGRTTLGNNIYGGGENSPIGGDTFIEVYTDPGPANYDNVFGGGTTTNTSLNGGWGNAKVGGDTQVVINKSDAVIKYSVYGGGEGNDINTVTGTKATVDMKDGTVHYNVYGGGIKSTAQSTIVNVSGGTVGSVTTTAGQGNVHGGGTNVDGFGTNPSLGALGNNAEILKTTLVNIIDSAKIGNTNTVGNNSSVYGGGEISPVQGSTEIRMSDGNVANDVYGGGFGSNSHVNGGGSPANTTTVTIGYAVGLQKGTVESSVYGGGHFNSNVTGNTLVSILNGAVVKDDVFGGGHNNAHISANTKVVIKGTPLIGTVTYDPSNPFTPTPPVDVVCGGGYAGADGTTIAQGSNVGGSTEVHHSGGIVEGSIYGGGYSEVTAQPCVVQLNTKVILDDDTAQVKTHIYGGGRNDGSDVNGLIGTEIEILKGTVLHNVFGGGNNNAKIANGGTHITIDAAKVGTLAPFNNGNATQDNPHHTRVDDVIFGGGTGTPGSTVKLGTLIEIGKPNDATIIADVHGGGDGTGNHILGADGTQININAGSVTGNVLGGGHDSDVEKTQIYHKALVDGSMWGGGVSRTTAKADVITAGTKIEISGGRVTGNVDGGGVSTSTFSANVNPDVDIDIINSAKVNGSVFGGGEVHSTGTAEISNNVDILVKDSSIDIDLWGGGHHNGAQYYVNGASNHAPVRGSVNMELNSAIIGTVGTTTAGNVYGGGQDNAIIGKVDQIHTLGNTIVYGSLYGGGHGTGKGDEINTTINVSNADQSDVVTILLEGETEVIGSVYGGGHYGHVYGSVDLDAVSRNFRVNIYGGGRNGDVEWNTDVHVHATADVGHSVYGGGVMDDPANVNAPDTSHIYTNGGFTNVIIDGHIHGSVYGGGHRVDVDNNSNQPGKGATVTINGTVGDEPLIGNDTDGRGTVYGGGRDANITNTNVGGTYVHIEPTAKVYWDVYGGGWNENGTKGVHGNVDGPDGTFVELNGIDETTGAWVRHNVYGGGRNFGNVTHNDSGTVVDLNDYSRVGRPKGDRGDVFGGGNYGDIMGVEGTQVTLQPHAIVYGTIYGGSYHADVTHPNGGTEVYIYGQVGDTYHTQKYTEPYGSDPRPSFYDLSEKDFYGNYTATFGNVYGGGNYGEVYGSRGTYLHVTDRPTGSNNGKAIVWNSVYGGGFEGFIEYDTVVDVNGGAEVYNSVFGGGQQHKTQPRSADAAQVHKTTKVNVTESDTKIGHEEMTRLTDNLSLTGGRANHKDPKFVNNDDLELHTGRIFGGGDFATVKGDSDVLVDSLDQIAFRTISGGGFGVNSINTHREVTLNQLGTGEGVSNAYDDLSVYTVIKHLCDYTNSFVDDCYLSVYYHLRSTDDNSDNGLAYPGYYPKDSMEYASYFNSTGGKLHSWRPYPHKDIIVDPMLQMNGTMFRMEAGYTIDLRPGGHDNTGVERTELLIDRDHRRLTATSKVYGPSNVVRDPDTFNYSHLPNTLNPKNLIDRGASVVCGISFYIPPIEIQSLDGESTNFGGTDVVDQTTGNTGAPEYEATDRTVSVRANEKDLVKKVQEAVKNTAAGKTAYVSESRYDQINPEVLSNVGKAATAAGGKAILMFDTMNGNTVQGRMYIDPAKPLPKNPINTRVYTEPGRISQAKANYENYYKNDFAFVQLGQNGSFGIEVEIAAKVNLQKLDTKNLIFYAYSESANSYKRIENPRYFIDKNGYLHFYTAVGGTVVITDEPLARK